MDIFSALTLGDAGLYVGPHELSVAECEGHVEQNKNWGHVSHAGGLAKSPSLFSYLGHDAQLARISQKLI